MAMFGQVDPMGVVNLVAAPIAQTAMVPITDHVGYMISCRKYVWDMQTKMTELNTAISTVEERIIRNTRLHLEIPTQVRVWLDEVYGIKANVENFPIDVISCCSLKIRHKLGRKAFRITRQIESFLNQHNLISWIDDPVPLGRVGSLNNASTTSPSTEFLSREVTFRNALKALEPNQNSHMIALCGIGGVGKTTMAEGLVNVVKEKKMFNFIVKVVIGEKPDPVVIQQAVADYLSIELKESTIPARVDKLHQWFKENSKNAHGDKYKFLLVLDDVWQSFDLKDFGLSPLPNQGVDFKVLLTSRDKHVCTTMGVEDNSILNVGLLLEAEAQSLFSQFAETSEPELHTIGENIVRKCCGLPIAIKTMACTLRNKRKPAWEDALSRLEHHDIDTVAPKVFDISFNNLQDKETKSIFLMCGLFPEDFHIFAEELVRYGWGIRLFDRVSTIREARNRLNTSIERLMQTNLLIETDVDGFVKMHDLVRAFVLDMFSKGEHATIVNHGIMSGWPENDMSGSCKQISLTCKGMSKFPEDLKLPNLLMLKLMYGERSLTFPQDLYQKMEKLQVMSYANMDCQLLPRSLECSTNLKVLYLHKCSLVSDCSSIGNLLNLEVLSFANSDIKRLRLPSTVGNLKRLRLLDLTNCDYLFVDNGVLKNLVQLEEIYAMVVDPYGRKGIWFSDDDRNDMAKHSENLLALDFEFPKNYALPENMSFKNLERFRISVGIDTWVRKTFSRSYENTLWLVTTKDELLESKINELFRKTNILCLTVHGMKDLEDVEVKPSHPPQFSSFYNLRILDVTLCKELRYLFTLGIANTLSKLESLTVDSCRNMEALIHTEGGGEETIRFPKLKFLKLKFLPKFLGFCDNVNMLELPQLVDLELEEIPGLTSIYSQNKLETSCLLKEEVAIPKLEQLSIHSMKNLKEIWPFEFSIDLDSVGESSSNNIRSIKVRDCHKLLNLFPCNPMQLLHHLEELRVEYCDSIEVLLNINLDSAGEFGESSSSNNIRSIKVEYCHKLVNLFPCNPMPFLHRLEELEVKNCGSIEALFDINLDSIGEIRQGRNGRLRTITAKRLEKLREIWRIKGENKSHLHIRGFEAVENIEIEGCHIISDSKKWGSNEEEEIDIVSEEEELQVVDSKSNVAFPSYLIHSVHNLRKLELNECKGVDVVFEIESPTTQQNQQPLLPYLKDLDISYMESMTHVWKCNWNNFLILQTKSLFHNLTTIRISECKSIKYMFSPLMAQFLSNLESLEISWCHGMEEVVSKRDDDGCEEKIVKEESDEKMKEIMLPRLKSITLEYLPRLKGFCLGKEDFSFPLLDTLAMWSCPAITTFTQGNLATLKLKQIQTSSWSLSAVEDVNYFIKANQKEFS